jgi:hypothetical protein
MLLSSEILLSYSGKGPVKSYPSRVCDYPRKVIQEISGGRRSYENLRSTGDLIILAKNQNDDKDKNHH